MKRLSLILAILATTTIVCLAAVLVLGNRVTSLNGQVRAVAAQEKVLQHEVDHLHSQVATATVASAPQPLAAWQDQNTTSCAADLILRDHKTAPIWWVLNCGGMWVGNDKLGVAGTQNYNQAIYMWTPDGVHGALVIDGWTLKAKDVVFLLCLEHHTEPACRAHYNRAATSAPAAGVATPAYP